MTAPILGPILGIIYLLWPGEPDPYHLIAYAIAALVVSAIAAWRAVRAQREQERLIKGRSARLQAQLRKASGDAPLVTVLKSVGWGLLTWLLAILIAWIGSLTPVYGMFYDADWEAVINDIRVLERHGDYESAAEVIDTRLQEPMSLEKRRELAEWKYNLLVQQGREVVPNYELARQYFAQAEEWASKQGLDAELANAEWRAAHPTQTAMPTFTPYPTQTPFPTYTPQPTVVVPTPAPTLPSGYVDCVSATLVDQVEPQAGELLRLYTCIVQGVYKVEWLLQSSGAQYSALIREGKPATFYRPEPFRVYVDLSTDSPKIRLSK